MALVCVSLVAATASALFPPDAFVGAWAALVGLLVAVPASFAYRRRGGSPGALWRYVLAVFAGSLAVTFFVLPLAVLFGVAGLLAGPVGFVAVAAVHFVAFVLVYRDGWQALKRRFVNAVASE